MWIFADFGLIMPAQIDDDLRHRADFEEYSEGGKYDFQVRGRIFEHLRYFQDTFMEEGTFHRDILATPDHDYNYRFYTTQEAFKVGLANAVMAIDYRKFKPTSERYEWGKPYHSILNSIWGDVCQMNTPGDIWGPWSPQNPRGYDSAKRYSSTWGNPGHRIGESFGNIDFGDGEGEFDIEEFEDERARDLIEELDGLNLSMNDWADNVSPREFEVLRPILRRHFSKKQVKDMARRNRDTFFTS